MSLEEYLKPKYSPRSVRGYENLIKRYKAELGSRAGSASHGDVLHYLGRLRQRGLHAKTVRNHLHAIKIYYSYLQASGKRASHPCRHLYLKDKPSRAIALEQLYSKTNLEELYETFPATPLRAKVILGLLTFQALTVSEISGLKTGDINLNAGEIRVKGTASTQGRKLPLKPGQILLLQGYLKKRTSTAPWLILNTKGKQLWPGSISRIINKGRKGLARISPQKVRQSVIANLLKSGGDVRVVQAFAGHRRAASTEAYQQTGLEELKMGVAQKHPLQ